MTSPVAGWYDDPAPGSAPGAQRFWDGQGWTEQTRSASAPALVKRAEVAPPPVGGAYAPVPHAYPPGPPAGYGPGQVGNPPVALTHTPDGMTLASPGKRLGAQLIDALILTVVSFLLIGLFALVVVGGGAATGVFDSTSTGEDPPPAFVVLLLGGYVLVYVVIAAISLWYHVIRLRQVGATPGKQILGLRVRTFHTDGQLTWGQAFGRWGLVLLASGVTGGVAGLVDVLWLLWDKHRQCLHDKAVGTVVVDSSVPRAPQEHPGVQLARSVPAARGWVADGPNPR